MNDGVVIMWAVMKLYPWDSLQGAIGSICWGGDEPSPGFIPVFEHKEDALKFAGSEELVMGVGLASKREEDAKQTS